MPAPSFTITGMDFINILNRNIIGTYGISFEIADIRFIASRITYNYSGSSLVNRTLDIKIIRPDGSLMTGASSSRGYTFSDILSIQPNSRGERDLLPGWGNENGGAYSAGIYTYEIWNNNRKLFSANFTVHAPFSITRIEIANTDKNLNIISSGTSFDVSDIRWIIPRITYDNTGSTSGNRVFNIKIINPDGSLMTYSESPRGYTINHSLNIQPNRRGERVLLTGLGSDTGGTYPVGTYTCEIWSDGQLLRSTRFSVVSGTASSASREIIFSYDGPQGSRARIFQDNQFLGTITPGNTFRRSVSNGRYTFEAQIEDTSNANNNSQRISYIANINNNTIYLNIVARRMPSGIIALRDFSIIRIIPPVFVTVTTDVLNVRTGPSSNHEIKDRIVRNTRVEVLERYTNSWVKIRYGNGGIGFVSGNMISP